MRLNASKLSVIVTTVLVLILLMIITSNALANTATLSWNANTESDLAGYRIYSGTSSRNYTASTDVGNKTNHILSGLGTGTHYFAVTAYDISGNESPFSIEGSKTISSSAEPPPTSDGLTISNLITKSGLAYEVINSGLNDGSPVYGDRTYSYSSVPTTLVGTTHLKTRNDDKSSSGNDFLSFDVNQNATVLVAHDDRIMTKPAWMGSFVDTGDNVMIDNLPHSLWKKDFSVGKVILGGNEGSAGSMYTVIALKSGSGPSIDTTVPSTPTNLLATAVSTVQVSLNWGASTDNVGVTGYRVFRNGVQIATTSLTSFTNTGLTAGTTYSYTVSAFDAAGNLSAPSSSKSVTTKTDELLISNIVVKSGPAYEVIKNSLVVGAPIYSDRTYLYASVPSTLVGTTYLKTRNNDKSSSGNDFLSFDVNQNATVLVAHDDRIMTKPAWIGSFVDTGDNVTIANQTHSLWKKNFSTGKIILGGNEGSGGSMYTVIVLKSGTGASSSPPSIDTISPSTPTILSATAVSAVQVGLIWTPSTDNVGVTGYRVFRNGVQIATTSVPSFTSTGLSAGTTYAYTVSAFDAAGNISALSASKSVTTSPLQDLIPPSTPTNILATSISTTQIKLTWSASTDNVGVTGYRVFLNGVQTGTTALPSFTSTGLSAGTAYAYSVSAFDAAGNTTGQSVPIMGTTFPEQTSTGEIIIKHSIGTSGRDFSTLQKWEDARDGDLTKRHYFITVKQTKAFLEGEIVFGVTSGAQGNYVKERDVPSLAETNMSLDGVLTTFQAGEVVMGATSGAEATIGGIISTTSGAIEQGVAYADTVFTAGVKIEGSTTDATHYMSLSVSPTQTHKGIPGRGVVIDINSLNHVVEIHDDHTRLEGFEITGWPNQSGSNSWEAIHVAANKALLSHLLIHDDDFGTFNNPNSDAIDLFDMTANQSVTIRNSTIYNIGRSAIIYQGSQNIAVNIENVTIFNTGLTGFYADDEGGISNRSTLATLSIRNTISMNSGSGNDFKNNGFYGNVSNNLSSDNSAPGNNSLPGRLAQDQFISILRGNENLHLKPGSEAINRGVDLSSLFKDDIDKNPRTSPWDIGSDESQ